MKVKETEGCRNARNQGELVKKWIVTDPIRDEIDQKELATHNIHESIPIRLVL